MKIKFLFPLFFVLVFSSVSFAQSVAVRTQKIVYTRPKPIADFKKTFTVNYPKVKAANAALSKKIEQAISYEKVLELNVQEEKTEVQWLEEADYKILYNKNGFLAVALSTSGTGAYPSTNTKTVVVDLKTGTAVKPTDVFTNLSGLAAELKKQQTAEIATAKKEIKADSENAETDADELFANADFTAENIDEFTIDDQGVSFKYDYGFPHVIQALQPEGNYSLTWAKLKPFLKKDGAFQKFAK